MTALDAILAYKRDEVAVLKAGSMAELTARAKDAEPVRGWRAALERARVAGAPSLIAEVKKASPSKGLIRADFDPVAIARAYEGAGATCLSVLTDAPSFQGAPSALVAARAACALPVLRKDFMIDPVQVIEARAMNADAILVILAAVDDTCAQNLMAAASEWSMDVLVEVHDEAEMERALLLNPGVIGVNNRDLRTFTTDLGVSERLAAMAPATGVFISESGVSTPSDIVRLRAAGVHGFLVGESLMRQADPGQAIAALFAHEPLAGAPRA